jgi:hypothetical protein
LSDKSKKVSEFSDAVFQLRETVQEVRHAIPPTAGAVSGKYEYRGKS